MTARARPARTAVAAVETNRGAVELHGRLGFQIVGTVLGAFQLRLLRAVRHAP
ncbi:hypothetical protein [Salinifilum ghardaiensis]